MLLDFLNQQKAKQSHLLVVERAIEVLRSFPGDFQVEANYGVCSASLTCKYRFTKSHFPKSFSNCRQNLSEEEVARLSSALVAEVEIWWEKVENKVPTEEEVFLGWVSDFQKNRLHPEIRVKVDKVSKCIWFPQGKGETLSKYASSRFSGSGWFECEHDPRAFSLGEALQLEKEQAERIKLIKEGKKQSLEFDSLEEAENYIRSGFSEWTKPIRIINLEERREFYQKYRIADVRILSGEYVQFKYRAR